MTKRLAGSTGQSLVEFAIMLPLILVVALGVIEFGWALLDQHVVTKLTREGSNLISRDSTIERAMTALRSMSTRPVNFDNGSKVIFSVIRKGSTANTPNFEQDILYQRYEYGSVPGGGPSRITTSGQGSYRGAPDYEAINADSDTRLQLTDMPSNLVVSPGGMVYVTEIYTTHQLLTPLHQFGITLPNRLYSIAYF
ncbi:MAG: TadE/TadG family type IV pilus assembly protein [Vicinamibacterales bacterium]